MLLITSSKRIPFSASYSLTFEWFAHSPAPIDRVTLMISWNAIIDPAPAAAAAAAAAAGGEEALSRRRCRRRRRARSGNGFSDTASAASLASLPVRRFILKYQEIKTKIRKGETKLGPFGEEIWFCFWEPFGNWYRPEESWWEQEKKRTFFYH